MLHAAAVLAAHVVQRVADLAQAVSLQEAGRLVKVPGIGKKTAERLLLELKGKLGADMREIWMMQPRFEKRTGNGPFSLVAQLRYRAGFDFLRLRAAVGEVEESLADWWQTFSGANDTLREDLIAQVREQMRQQQRTRQRKADELPLCMVPVNHCNNSGAFGFDGFGIF